MYVIYYYFKAANIEIFAIHAHLFAGINVSYTKHIVFDTDTHKHAHTNTKIWQIADDDAHTKYNHIIVATEAFFSLNLFHIPT